MNDQSGVYRDDTGPDRRDLRHAGRPGFRRLAEGIEVEVISADHQNKADVGASIAREWFDRGGVDAIVDVPTSSVALGGGHGLPREEQGVPQFGGGVHRPDRVAVQPEHRPLDLRHLYAGEVHRRGDRAGRGRHLVLRDRELRLRPAIAARHVALHRRGRGQGARLQHLSVPGDLGFLRAVAGGAGIGREGAGAVQFRRGHGQLHQAGA